MKKLKNKRGFSLVELMVVVAIMGTRLSQSRLIMNTGNL